MIEKFLSAEALLVWYLLENPDEWFYPRSRNSRGLPYTMVHKGSLVSLWINNGKSFLNGYNDTVYSIDFPNQQTLAPNIGVIDRLILWTRVKMVMRYLNQFEPSVLKSLIEYRRSINK